MPKALPSCLFFALAATSAWAQRPVGTEFQVNSYPTASQYDAAVAMDGGGNFVVVWKSTQIDLGDIFGRRFDSAGTPLGTDFLVNSSLLFPQGEPAVASAPAGPFVVVWDGFDASGGGVRGQRYAETGSPAGGEFPANASTTSSQYWGSVATDAAGDFVVVWSSFQQDSSGSGVFGQRFDAAGALRGQEFQINSYTTSYQVSARVAVDADGDFVVIWQSQGQDGSGIGVFGQRYSAAGARLGAEFQVNTTTAGTQRYPQVASAADGQFVVAWQGTVGAVNGIGARRYDASGAALGAEFLVSQDTTNTKEWPSIDSDAAGNFIVTWTGGGQDGSSRGIFARGYDRAGIPLGPEFRVNTYTTGDQVRSAVALGPSGAAVITWESYGQDSPGTASVFGQRFSDLIFADGFDPAGS